MDTSASIKLKFIKLNSSLGHAIGFAVSRGGIGAKNINSYLIEQLARASHLPTTRFGKREASGAFNVRPETTEVGRCAEQELQHLLLRISPKLHALPSTPKCNNEGLTDVR